MKISKKQLKRIIKEELEKITNEEEAATQGDLFLPRKEMLNKWLRGEPEGNFYMYQDPDKAYQSPDPKMDLDYTESLRTTGPKDPEAIFLRPAEAEYVLAMGAIARDIDQGVLKGLSQP